VFKIIQIFNFKIWLQKTQIGNPGLLCSSTSTCHGVLRELIMTTEA